MKLKELFPNINGTSFGGSGEFGKHINNPYIIDDYVGKGYLYMELGIIKGLMQAQKKEWRIVEQSLKMHKGRYIDEIKLETQFVHKNRKQRATESIFIDISAVIDQMQSMDPDYDFGMDRKLAIDRLNGPLGEGSFIQTEEFPSSELQRNDGLFRPEREWKGRYQPTRSVHTIKNLRT